MPKELNLEGLVFETTGATVFLLFGYPDEHSNHAQVVRVYASETEAEEVGADVVGMFVAPAVVGQPVEF